HRQSAKAVNFGTPGGLGAVSLVAYAKANYGVALTLEEAKKKRLQLTQKVYRELNLYLAEDGPAVIARNLHADLAQLRLALGDIYLSSIRRILQGDPRRQDGQPYQSGFVEKVWLTLAAFNRNPELRAGLDARRPSRALADRVCQSGVATLTGRIRGR